MTSCFLFLVWIHAQKSCVPLWKFVSGSSSWKKKKKVLEVGKTKQKTPPNQNLISLSQKFTVEISSHIGGGMMKDLAQQPYFFPYFRPYPSVIFLVTSLTASGLELNSPRFSHPEIMVIKSFHHYLCHYAWPFQSLTFPEMISWPVDIFLQIFQKHFFLWTSVCNTLDLVTLWNKK